MAACTSPDGVAGGITWNGTDSVIWCDGTTWYALKNAAGASGSAGYIQFSNGSGGFSNSGPTAGQQLFWDDTNKRLGIGTTTPSGTLYVKGNTVLSDDTANVTASYPLRVYSASSSSGLVNLYYQNADVNGAILSLQKYKSGGNEIAAGDILGSIDFFGTTGAGNSLRAAQIRATAETGWGGTGDAPGRLTFWTTPDGSSTAVERMRIDNAGNVGIGTTSPGYKLHVTETRTDTSAGNFVMTRDDLNVNPGANSASTFIARMHRADIPSGNGFNITGAINSASNYTTHTGTGTVAVAYGSASLVDNLSATGIITNATGANNAARGNSAGTITGAYGASNIAHTMNAAATMTSGYGAYNAAQTTLGTMTNGFGSYDAVLHNAPTTMAVARGSTSAISVGSGATVTTAYGVYTSLSNAGTVASWYGLYVPASTGTAPTTNRYPVYVVDTGSNYFAGNVGIGTSTPGSALHVSGTDNTAYATSSSAADGPAFLSSPTAPMVMIGNIGNTDGQGAYLSFLTRNSAANGQRAYIGAISNTAGRAPTIVFGQQTSLTGYAERMRITATGDVGIGTTTASYDLSFGGEAARTIGMERTSAGTNGYGLTLQAGGAKSATADLNGGALTLSSGTATGTGSSNIYFKTAAAGATGTADRAPGTAMTILGNNNVGIGTTSPSYLLHVGSTGTLTAFNGNAGNTFTPQIVAQPSSGVAGVGAFVVNGTNNRRAALFMNDTDTLWGLSQANSSGGAVPFIIRQHSTGEVLRIDSNGNVGIGTITPAAKLDVNGFMRLAKNGSAPATCDATIDGAVALTSARRMCVCDATSWKEVNSVTACTW